MPSLHILLSERSRKFLFCKSGFEVSRQDFVESAELDGISHCYLLGNLHLLVPVFLEFQIAQAGLRTGIT